MLAYIATAYDFGYTWPWTYGHLVAAAALAIPAWLLYNRLRWAAVLLGALALWAFAGFLIVTFAFGFNSPVKLPTPAFFASGRGEVLDIGCGSGRATVMVGTARPSARIAALDNFSADYIRDNGETRLRQNLRIAGIDDSRVRVIQADMRQIPAADNEFAAVVSTYAIDHLNREGIRRTLSEVNRVLAPGGDFLLMIIHADGWLKVTYGPLLMHTRGVGPNFWPDRLREAGLMLIEQGTTPGSAHYLARKPGSVDLQ